MRISGYNTCNPLFYMVFVGSSTRRKTGRWMLEYLWTILPGRRLSRVIHTLLGGMCHIEYRFPRPASFGQLSHQLVPVFAQDAVGLLELVDMAAGVHHGGVVTATEGVPDFRQAVLRQLAG